MYKKKKKVGKYRVFTFDNYKLRTDVDNDLSPSYLSACWDYIFPQVSTLNVDTETTLSDSSSIIAFSSATRYFPIEVQIIYRRLTMRRCVFLNKRQLATSYTPLIIGIPTPRAHLKRYRLPFSRDYTYALTPRIFARYLPMGKRYLPSDRCNYYFLCIGIFAASFFFNFCVFFSPFQYE